jgi:glutaredoxin
MQMFLLFLVSMLASSVALSPVLKAAGQGMQLLKPIFSLETKAQAAVLGAIGSVDKAEVMEELALLGATPCVIYTYGLSPFSTQALDVLKNSGAVFETRELGLEWFLLGPRASVLRAELENLTGQSSLPQVFIGGKSIGGLATGTPGMASLIYTYTLHTIHRRLSHTHYTLYTLHTIPIIPIYLYTGLASLVESGELEVLLKKAKAL